MENKIDLQFIKRPLIFIIIILVVSVVLMVFGQQFETAKLDQYNSSKSSLQRSHRTYKKLVEDLDLLDLYTKSYKKYRKSGLLGPERRLSWVESLEAVNDVLQLPKLSYELDPQEEFKQPKLQIVNNIKVSSTPMKLEIELLHEEDLFVVFEGIQNNIDSLFTIDSCKITRLGKRDSVLSTQKANLRSSCLLRWITVDVQS